MTLRISLFTFPLILLLVFPLWGPGAMPAAPAATCQWNGASGDWHSAANWSCHTIPGNGDDVVIPGGAVSLNSPVTVHGLTLEGGTLTGSGQLTVTASFVWTGGTLGGAGILSVALGATGLLSGAETKTLAEGRILENNGTITWSGGEITEAEGYSGSIHNHHLFEVQCDQTLGSPAAAATFDNTGTLRKSAGAGVATLAAGFTLHNHGTVAAQKGTLRIDGPHNASTHDGVFLLNGGTLEFAGGSHHILEDGWISGTGKAIFSGATVTVDGGYALSGETEVISGELQLNTASLLPALELSAGVLAGTGTITVTEVLTWSGGVLGGSGWMTIQWGASASLEGAAAKTLAGSRVLRNRGVLAWSGTGEIALGPDYQGHIENQNGASISLQSDATWGALPASSPATFLNAGTLRKLAGSGTSRLGPGLVFTNAGTVAVQSGTLAMNTGGQAAHSGVFSLANGAGLDFASGTHTLLPGAALSGPGNVSFSGAEVALAGLYLPSGITSLSAGKVTLLAATTLAEVHLSGGELACNAALAITTGMNWTGGILGGTGSLTLGTNATTTLEGPGEKRLGGGLALINAGILQLDNGNLSVESGFNGTLKNQGVFDVRTDTAIGSGGEARGTFENAGTLRKSAGDGSLLFGPGMEFHNSGTVSLRTGSLQMNTDSLEEGVFSVWSGTRLLFSQGQHRFLTGSSLNSAGEVEISGGRVMLQGAYTSASTRVSGGTADFRDGNIDFGDFTQTGGEVKLENAGISGNLVRSGGDFEMQNGTLAFDGMNTQALTVTLPTHFANLAVGANATLVERGANDYVVVDGQLANEGVIRREKPVTGPGELTFGLAGVRMMVIEPGSLTSVQVERVGGDHPNADEHTHTGQYWRISGVGSGFFVTLTLPHTLPAHELTMVCRYLGSGSQWSCARISSTPGTVTRWAVSSFSEWAVGDFSATGIFMWFLPAMLK